MIHRMKNHWRKQTLILTVKIVFFCYRNQKTLQIQIQILVSNISFATKTENAYYIWCQKYPDLFYSFKKEVENPDRIWGQFHQHFTWSFYTWRSQKRKKDLWLDCLFALLGSSSVNAAGRMLMKLTSGCLCV